MMTGLFQLISFLVLGLFMYTMYSIVIYANVKKQQDEQVLKKLEELLQELKNREKKSSNGQVENSL